MSKFGITSFILFLLLSSIGRLVFPFGDEPDYGARLERFNNQDKFILNPFKYIDLYKNIPIDHDCSIDSGSKSVWARIDSSCLDLNFKFFLSKIFITLLLVMPLLMAVIYRRPLYMISRSSHYFTYEEWNKRLDAISLSILFPSLIYMLGLLSNEVFVLVYALFIFLFWGRPLLVLSLLLMIYTIDDGNFVVVLGFVVLLMSFKKIYLLIGMRGLILCSIAAIMFSFFFGKDVLLYLANSDIQSKFSQIYNSIIEKSAYDNYPLVLRPVITYMSFIFMSSSGIKSILLYIVVSIFFVYTLIRGFRQYKFEEMLTRKFSGDNPKVDEFTSSIIALLVVITTITCFVYMLPTHAYAKYYIFMIPFVVLFLLQFINKWKLMISFVLFSFILFTNMMIYYI